MENTNGILSMKEVGELLARLRRRDGKLVRIPLSHVSIRGLIRAGVLRSHRLGQQVYFLRDEVLEDIRRMGPNAEPQQSESAEATGA